MSCSIDVPLVVEAHARLVAVVRRDHVDEPHDRVGLVADAEYCSDLRIGREPVRMQVRECLVARVLAVLAPVVLAAHAVGGGDDVGERRRGAEVDPGRPAVVGVEHARRTPQNLGHLHARRIAGEHQVGPEPPREPVEREVAVEQLPRLADPVLVARLADALVRDVVLVEERERDVLLAGDDERLVTPDDQIGAEILEEVHVGGMHDVEQDAHAAPQERSGIAVGRGRSAASPPSRITRAIRGAA